MMNDEKLIEFVRNYTVLYDQSDARYMDTEYKNSLWKKIGTQMNMDGTACKIRWTNIRDNFRKSLIKQKTKSGQGAKVIKAYKYSSQLNFLVKFFEERETKTNISQDSQDVVNLNAKEDDQNNEMMLLGNEKDNEDDSRDIDDPTPAHSETYDSSKGSSPIPRKKIKKKPVSTNTPPQSAALTLMEYLINKNQKSTQDSQHPIDAFLSGISATLKKLPLQEQHYAKGEIFAIAQKYELKMLLNQDQNTSEISSHIE